VDRHVENELVIDMDEPRRDIAAMEITVDRSFALLESRPMPRAARCYSRR